MTTETSSRRWIPYAVAFAFLLLALASYAGSRVFVDVSFVKGFFQGATAALLAGAVFAFVMLRRAARAHSVHATGRWWLPSRDGALDASDDRGR